jgi:uracil-DNA glycosylase family 4
LVTASETNSAAGPWRELTRELARCRDCRQPGLLHESAKPLFGRFRPRRRGVLFVFEAPNHRDTTHPAKGYITYDQVDDQTGRFTKELFTQILRMPPEEFHVTNAVLCLPRRINAAFPVYARQVRNCSSNLRRQIEVLDPLVVVSVGRTALDALSRIQRFPYVNFRCVIGRPRPWLNRWIFPLAHTSRQGRLRRPEETQRSDWRALASFLQERRAHFSGCDHHA